MDEMLLLAVQAAREAARRAQCQNNLKQLGLALQNFEGVNKQFPAGSYWYDARFGSCGDPGQLPCEDNRGTYLVHILPFIEQQQLFDAFDFLTTDPEGITYQLMPDGAPIGDTSFDGLICPSDEHPDAASQSDPAFQHFKMTNYEASRGNTTQLDNIACKCAEAMAISTPLFEQGEAVGYPEFPLFGLIIPRIFVPNNYGGPFSRGWKAGIETKAREVTDGLSNAIFLGEVRPACSENFARGWHYANAGHGVVSTTVPINYDMCSRDHPNPCHRWCNWGTSLGFKSSHPGGAYFAMGDASVRFISETIDMISYQRLGGKADERIINYSFQ